MLTEEELKDAQNRLASIDTQIATETDAEKLTELKGQKLSIEQEMKQETPEEKMARLEEQNTEFTAKEKTMMEEHSQLGRRNKELVERQDKSDENIRKLTETIRSMNAPKTEDAGFRDLNDPVVADKWFDEKVNERVGKENREQTEYAKQYDKDVDTILEGRDAEEREFIMAGLEKQKKNMFNDPKLDAEYNIDKVSTKYWKEKAMGGNNTPLNLKRDKATNTGVGGESTVSPTATKKVVETPEMAKLRNQFADYDKMKGYKVKSG